MPLNEKQNHFAHAYIACGGNGRAAAIQAGYSRKTEFEIIDEAINTSDAVFLLVFHVLLDLIDFDCLSSTSGTRSQLIQPVLSAPCNFPYPHTAI